MKKWKKIVTIIICMILVVSSTGNITATGLSDAQKEKKALQQELQEAQDLIDELKDSKEDIAAKVRKLDESLTSISGRINELEEQMEQKQLDIEDASELLEQAEADAATQYESMKTRIKYMYEQELSQSLLDALFTSGSIAEFISQAEYIKQITAYDREMLEKYQDAQANIVTAKEALQTEYDELQELKDQVELEQQAVQDLMAAKEKQLEAISDELSEAQQNVDVVQAEIDAQNEIIAQIKAEEAKKAAAKKAAEEAAKKAAEQTSETEGNAEQSSDNGDTTSADDTYSGGTFTWPVPSSKRITSDYGTRLSPTAGASTNHKGIDIGAAYGADIVAAAEGTVSVAAYSSSLGNYVMISHGSGLYTVYGHCSSLLVSSGTKVKAGQVIAKVGSTGISTGNHLHFGVSLNGSYVSPWNYVSK